MLESFVEFLKNLRVNSQQYHTFLEWLQKMDPRMIHFLQPFFERKQLSLGLMPMKHSINSMKFFFVTGGMTWLLLKKLFCKIKQNHRTHFHIMHIIMRRVTMMAPKLSKLTCSATLEGHSHSVWSVAFHPTAPLLATGSGDNTAKLWKIGPDGSASDMTCVATLARHSRTLYSVAFHPTAPLLATSSWDETVKLWHFSANDSEATCVATLAAPLVGGHSSGVRSVAFHPTAPLLATGSADRTAKLWHFSPDGSTVTCVTTLVGHSSCVTSVAFHPTAPLLATGSDDFTAKLWRFSPDGSAATCVATLAGHSDWVRSVAFHPTAPLLATGSDDNKVKLWK